jgi:prepilin-type N-terminal cleavage/methylation domain-containing protein/prepilin-type processing-associated H-X9-DG protein
MHKTLTLSRIPARYRGFTLIELLVVIAIIGILASMLMPVLGRSKQRAQGVQCLSNLGQMSLGWQLYASDNTERFPVDASLGDNHATVGQDTINPSWVAGILATTTTPDNTNIDKLVGSAYTAFGSIGGYIKNAGVYHCPADISVDAGNHHLRVRSISMNSWMNPGKVNQPDSAFWTAPFKKFTSATDFGRTSPVNIFVFVDERPESINDGWFRISTSGYNRDGSVNASLLNYEDLPAVYHNNASAMSFADGHCELHRWQGGNLLDDNDLAWLMTHATVPQ